MDFWHVVTEIGDFRLWLLLFLIASLTRNNKRLKRVSYNYIHIIFPSIVLAIFIAVFLKNVFQIPRPCVGEPFCPSDYSFPSGHSSLMFALFMSSVFAFKDKKLSVLLFLLAVLVAISRVEIGVHRVADIEFGVFVGILSALTVWILSMKKKTINKRWFLRKLIHSTTVLLVFLRIFDERLFIFLTTLSIISYTLLEYIRVYKKKRIWLYSSIIRKCKKQNEKGFIVSPLLVPISFLLIDVFGLEAFIVGGLALSLGDAIAGFIGKEFGRIRFSNKKSLEGSVSLFLVLFFVYFLAFGVEKALVYSILATSIEAIIPEMDNLVLPLALALIVKLL